MDTTMTTIDSTTPTRLLAPLTHTETTPGTPGYTTSTKPAIEGDKVLYVLAEGHHKGEVRGAIVTQSWSRTVAGAVNLCVFTDFTNDFYMDQKGSDGTLWRSSVSYSAEKLPGTWHWPETSEA